MLLSIDPGLDTGWALFQDNVIINCGLGIPPTPFELRQVVIECPFIYPGGRTKNPNDVLKVAVMAGEHAGRYQFLAPCKYVYPAQWKGQTPKDIQHARDWAKLSATEQSIIDNACKGLAPSKRHNLLDAVGIGLWALKR